MEALLRVGYFEFTWPSDIKYWVTYGNGGDKCLKAFPEIIIARCKFVSFNLQVYLKI